LGGNFSIFPWFSPPPFHALALLLNLRLHLFSVVNVPSHAVEAPAGATRVKKGAIVHHVVWSNSEQWPVEDFRIKPTEDRARRACRSRLDPPAANFKQSNETLLLRMADYGGVDRPALAPIGFGISSLREKGAE